MAKSTKTKEEGVVWLSSAGGYYDEPEIDVDKLFDYTRNYYGAGVAQKQRNLIFPNKYTLEVLDPDGEPDEDLAQNITTMCSHNDVRLWSRMKMAWYDCFWFGMSFFNPVWGMSGAEYTLKKLRHLPAHSFATTPFGSFKVAGEILEGVVLNQKNEIEYHQDAGDGIPPIQLTNVFTVKDPTSTEIAGTPIVLPIVPIISMLKFSWQAQMQKINRVGAPILFLKITNPKGDDIAYGNKILQNWGKNTAYQLRENMELVDPGLEDNTTALDTIDVLNRMVVDFFSPASLISKDGTLIGGSSASEQELMQSYIMGIHSWLEDAFEQLLQEYLDVNGYEGYHVEIHIPSPNIDRSEIELKQAQIGAKTGRLTDNEIRKRLGAPELSDDELDKLREQNQPAIPTAIGMKEPMVTDPAIVEERERTELEQAHDILDGIIEALENE